MNTKALEISEEIKGTFVIEIRKEVGFIISKRIVVFYFIVPIYILIYVYDIVNPQGIRCWRHLPLLICFSPTIK